jgi:hypothetical protein
LRALALGLLCTAAWADVPPLDAQLQRHAACTADAQCRSIGVGARPCGGPAGWRAYSTAGLSAAQEKALIQQAQREAAAQRAAQAAEGRMGICQVLPDPGAHCSASQRCAPGLKRPD